MSQNKPQILILVFVAMSQFSSAFMHSIMGVTLPAIGSDLDASGVELGLAESIFMGTAAALLLPIGRFADVTDKNTLFKSALLALGITTFAIGFQPSIESVIGARFLQGVAAAFLTATGMAIVADIAPRNRLGQMLGLAIGATYVGLAVGPYFAGLVTTHLGWRWVFYLAATPPMLSYLLSRATLKSKWHAPKKSVNLTNSALLFFSIMAFIAGAVTLKQTVMGTALIALGVSMGGLFIIAERRSADPLIQVEEIFANRALSQALVIQFLIYCGTIGTTFLLSLYLQYIQGKTPESTGNLLVLAPVVMAVFAPLAGRVADLMSPRRLSALAALITERTDVGLIIAIMAFQGLGFAMFSAPNIALIMNSVSPAKRGLASALSAVMRTLGMVVSMFIVTAFLSIQLGDGAIGDHPGEFLWVMSWSFIIFAVLTAFGAVLATTPRR